MATPPGRPNNSDATMDFDRPPTIAKPTPDQTIDQPAPLPPNDPGGGTLNYPSTPAPATGQQTLDLPGEEPVAVDQAQQTGMWSSTDGEGAGADFSFSSKAGVLFDPDKAGEIEPLPDVPGVPGYEILGELGRGAMGVVYKARQTGLKRLVALKMILSGGHASKTEIVRFRTEAEAVARLQHPNIVQVFEIGEHRGLPFFSLEFVDGGCLADKLSEQGVPVREAARLVRQLAEAMACAHEGGIVHRDLKPANVLMTKDGQPKVTDFGLAKKLEEDSGATRAGSIMGTPSYMAPEQAEGRQDLIGPHSDIYALGAILYDLLTGRPPFRGTTVLETLTQVRMIEPVPPIQLLPHMPRDLQTICLKCLSKEPKRRYATARTLAEDLRRFLEGEPILARPVSRVERAWKWSKRHPSAAALAVVSVLSVVTLTIVGLVVFRNAVVNAEVQTRLREVADQQAERAEGRFKDARDAVEYMLTRVAEEKLENEPHVQQVQRDLLEKAGEFYRRFLEVDDPSPTVRREAAQTARKIGEIRAQLKQDAQAEASFRQSLQLLDELAADEPGNSGYRQDLAGTCLNLANYFSGNGRAKEAEPYYRRAIELNKKLLAEEPDNVGRRRELAVTHYNCALLEERTGRPLQANLSLRSALELQQKLCDDEPTKLPLRRELVGTLMALGRIKAASQPAEAEAAQRQALQALDQLQKDDPDSRFTLRQIVLVCTQLGDLLRDNRPKEARPLFDRGVRLGSVLVDKFPTVPEYQRELAACLNSLGLWQLAAGNREAADTAFDRALQLKQRLVTTFPKQPDYRLDLAKSLGNRGLTFQTAGRPAQAAQAYGDSVAALRTVVADFPDVPSYQRELALALGRLATLDPARGVPVLQEALQIQERLVEREARSRELLADRAGTEQLLGTILLAQNKAAEAEKHLRRAEADFRDLVNRFSDDVNSRLTLGTVLINLGQLLEQTNRRPDAEKALKEAVALLGDLAKDKPEQPAFAREHAKALHNLGNLLTLLTKYGEAEKTNREAVARRKEIADRLKDDPTCVQDLAKSYAALGMTLAYRGSTAAEDQFRTALALLNGLHKKNPKALEYLYDLINEHGNYAALLQGLGRDDVFAQLRARIACKDKLAKLMPAQAEPRAEVARAYHELALHLKQGRPDEVRPAYEDAIQQWKQAIEMDAKQLEYRAGLGESSLGLAEVLVAEKKPAQAVKAVTDGVVGTPAAWPRYHVASAIVAQCIPLALAESKLADMKRKEIAKGYGDVAVDLMRKAGAAGFRDADAVKKAAAFAPLLERQDFQQVLAEMVK